MQNICFSCVPADAGKALRTSASNLIGHLHCAYDRRDDDRTSE